MLYTEQLEFEVVGKENNHLWLRILHGEDEGMRLSVPVRAPEHDDDQTELLYSLTHRDVVRAKLCSRTTEYPDWRVDSIQQVDPKSSVSSSAD